MLCDACKEREHVISLTTVEDNVVTLVHLCEKCAAERGIETAGSAAQHPLGAFMQEAQRQATRTQGDAVRCSFCSTTLRDFRTSGRLGCAHCYGAFEQSLRELLRRVHGNARHVGRRYEAPQAEWLQRASTLGELRERLRRAVELEQFELAASIRDQIREFE